jgi:hypothetical protein
MTGPAANHGGEALSPGVRELVDQVRARAGSAMTLEQVRELSTAAGQVARGKIHTVEEVDELFELAQARIGEITDLMLELTALEQGG